MTLKKKAFSGDLASLDFLIWVANNNMKRHPSLKAGDTDTENEAAAQLLSESQWTWVS